MTIAEEDFKRFMDLKDNFSYKEDEFDWSIELSYGSIWLMNGQYFAAEIPRTRYRNIVALERLLRK